MWTMIIADDEPIIIRGIRKMVDWEKMGIQIVGCCNDGSSALMEIVKKKPDIAILDISMPGKTGLDILKEMNCIGLATKVVFISGFQQFDYAVEALRLGAVNYLLKPVNKDDLIENVKSCLGGQAMPETKFDEEKPDLELLTGQTAVYEALVEQEETSYVPAAVYLYLDSRISSVERRLIEFSIYHAVEKYIQDQGMGILFYRNKKPCVVFKNCTVPEAREYAVRLIADMEAETHNRIGLALGEEVSDMADIPLSYQKAQKACDSLYFKSGLTAPVAVYGETVSTFRFTYQDMKESRQKIMEAAIEMDVDRVGKEFDHYRKIVSSLSMGDRETAVFHLLTIIHMLEERLDHMGISTEKLDSNRMIAEALECGSYDQMCGTAFGFLTRFIKIMQGVLQKNDKKDIIRARAYIEDHYMENLTLDVMAQYVHMNASYFSSFFKKQTGENFKEYLNKIRLKHALELLLSTDKKSYEIADEVGFSEAKYFSELFQKMYGKTPVAYRKELRSGIGN